MFQVPGEISFEDLLLFLVREWFPEGVGTEGPDFEAVLGDLIRSLEGNGEPSAGKDKKPKDAEALPLQLPVRSPFPELAVKDGEPDPETAGWQKPQDFRSVQGKEEGPYLPRTSEVVRVISLELEKTASEGKEEAPYEGRTPIPPEKRTKEIAGRIPIAEHPSMKPEKNSPERHAYKTNTEGSIQLETPQPKKTSSYAPPEAQDPKLKTEVQKSTGRASIPAGEVKVRSWEVGRHAETSDLRVNTRVLDRVRTEDRPERPVKIRPPAGETVLRYAPERQPDDLPKGTENRLLEEPPPDVRQEPRASERVYARPWIAGEHLKPDTDPIRREAKREEPQPGAGGPSELKVSVHEGAERSEGPKEVTRQTQLPRPPQEVRQVSLRIEEASLKFKLQGNSLTVEVRTPQEIQNQLTFMESYRLVKNLQSIGITLESLRINGVEMVPKGIRSPRREDRERFNIGENEGLPEEASGRPADSPDLSLLL